MAKDEWKTSAKWYEEYKDIVEITEPTAWDMKNINYAWHEEKINENKFNYKLFFSKCFYKDLKEK